MATEDNLRKGLTFVFTVIGLGIFYIIVMTKVKVMAQETEAKILKQSAEQAWAGFLYQKTVDSLMEEKNAISSEDTADSELPE